MTPTAWLQNIESIARRYAETLAASPGRLAALVVLALGLALAAALLSRPRARRREPGEPERQGSPWLTASVLGCLLGLGLWHALDGAWVADDAFISFRYAENLARGHGLVFNPGERVEGYTNFSWTLLLALAIRLGLPPGEVTLVLAPLCMLGTVALAARLVSTVEREAGRPAPGLPVAALLLVGNHAFTSFGTSGLETAFAGLLILASLSLAVRRQTLVGALGSGTLGVLAAMTHPELGLQYAALGALLVLFTTVGPARASGAGLAWRAGTRTALAWALPFFVLYLPWFLWRWSYYGQLWPNTYHAKLGFLTYWSQGSLYLLLFLLGSGWWLGLPLLPWSLLARGGSRNARLIAAFAGIGALLHVLYVVRVGGDFMYGRFFVPLLAPLLVAVELGVRRRLAAGRPPSPPLRACRAVYLTLAVTLAAGGALGVGKLIRPRGLLANVADEESLYPVGRFSPLRIESSFFEHGQTLGRVFSSWTDRPLFRVGVLGMVGYYSRLPIIDTFGLVDEHTAHAPFDASERGRPGHERRMDTAYLLQRGVLISKGQRVHRQIYDPITRMTIAGNSRYWIACYDPPTMKRLRAQPGIKAVDFIAYLDGYLLGLAGKTEKTVRADLRFFRRYYFDHHPDPDRLEVIEAFLARRTPESTAVSR